MLLEAFGDGWGTWRFLPNEGSILDQPEALIEDLLRWKYLSAIARKQTREPKESDDKDLKLPKYWDTDNA